MLLNWWMYNDSSPLDKIVCTWLQEMHTYTCHFIPDDNNCAAWGDRKGIGWNSPFHCLILALQWIRPIILTGSTFSCFSVLIIWTKSWAGAEVVQWMIFWMILLWRKSSHLASVGWLVTQHYWSWDCCLVPELPHRLHQNQICWTPACQKFFPI